jgi:NAD(P)-dependent dehydrogenase (short-subunit alcohol dehydrogenase family)
MTELRTSRTGDVFDLDGKVAVVSGGSRGIGEAAALLLARYGARVIVSSRKLESSEAAAARIRAAGGIAHAHACHIGDLNQIESLFTTVDREHGRLDILVNCAAANPYFGPLVDIGAAAFQKTFDINVRGYFFSSAAAVKIMARCGGGSIINVGSINAVAPMENQGVYAITKGAIMTMTRAFALECAPSRVRVNAVLPGVTRTRFSAALTEDDEFTARALARIPLKRIAEPQEMAGAIVYLASDAASYATGLCMNVDGGYLAA